MACWLRSGSRCSRVARARCRALLADADRGLECRGRLAGGVAEDLTQDQHRALVRRQVLEGRDEGQLDRLAALVAGVGTDQPVLELELVVGIRLDPDGLGDRHSRLTEGIGARPEIDRMDPLSVAPSDRVQAGVGGDRVEPGAQGAAALEALDRAPGAKHRLLKSVLGIVEGTEHPVAVSAEFTPVGLHDQLESALVLAPGGLDQPLRLALSRTRDSRHSCAG